MFDFSLSVVAWLAVVIFQAIIHFGVIGPRSRRQRERLEKEQMEIQSQMEECDSKLGTNSTGDNYEQYAASLASAAVEAEEAEAEAEEAETDSGDELRTFSLHEGRASFTRRSLPHLARKYGGSLASGSRSESYRDLDPARVDGSHSEGEDHVDSGDIDEDEPWRYELVRYYYSTRSPHVIQLDRYRQHETYDSDEMEDNDDFRSRMKARRSWNNSRRNMRESNGFHPGRKQDGEAEQPSLNPFPPPQDGSGSRLRFHRDSEKNKDRHVAWHSSSLSGLASQVIPCA